MMKTGPWPENTVTNQCVKSLLRGSSLADIFISYARADREKVEQLASALEGEGYSVWWDRHIESGAEFSADIERELEAAKAVIVCWSEEGAKSRWVKDEATIAHRAGKLKTISLDGTEPPIGYMQFHSHGMSSWKGGRDETQFIELRDSIAAHLAKLGEEAPVPQTAMAKSESPSIASLSDKILKPLPLAAMAATVVAIIAGVMVMGRGNNDGATENVAAIAQEIDRSKSIAVLPFADFSSEGNQEWFSDGLTDEILNSLARTPDLLVASRTSSFSYKGTSKETRIIAQELGVAHILEGSVRRAGDRLRITAQLIRASDGFHLWSQNYDRSTDDTITIQEEIAIEIAKALKTAMDPEALIAMAEVGTHSVEAYELYLRARAIIDGWQDGSAQERLSPIELIEQARAIDPQFAYAHWEAAFYYRQQLSPTRIGSDNDLSDVEGDLEKFLERIDAAIATAPRAADREIYQGMKSEMLFQQRRALESYERFAEAYPLARDAWFGLANAQINFGDFEAARQSLTNLRPLIENEQRDYGPYVLYSVYVQDYQGAAAFAREALKKAPNNGLVIYQAHRAFLWNGAVDEARDLLPLLDASPMPQSAREFAKVRQACADGDRQTAEAIIAGFSERDLSGRWMGAYLLGEKDEAADLLRPYDRAAPPYPLESFLAYPFFDPTPFPNISALMAREGITPPPILDAPFLCPPAEAN